MSFSQRKGLVSTKLIQKDSIDDDLRSCLWNAIHACLWEKVEFDHGSHDQREYSNFDTLFKRYWHTYFKKPLDTLPDEFSEAKKTLRDHFFKSDWHVVLSFIEFTAKNCPKELQDSFIKLCNLVLEAEVSAYRFVDKEIVEITSEEELSSINDALNNTKEKFHGVNTHLKTALSMLSDRKNPDYRNSIKESISAVESLAHVLTENSKASLGDALIILEQKGGIHSALKKSLSSLYGYTSEEGGIRHAMLEEPNLTFYDAKFMLVSCTSFVNYLISKAA